MKTSRFPWRLVLAVVVLVAAVALPAGAAKLRTVTVARVAVFQVASSVKISVGTDRAATLQDLTVGDRVSIAYAHENGALVAYRVTEGVGQKHVANRISTLPAHHHRATDGYEHMRGVVRAVDVQGGTVKIMYWVRVL